MTESAIIHHASGSTTLTGDAIELFRARTCWSAIKMLHKHGIKPCRGVGMKQLLAIASEYTGQTYKGKKDADRAVADLDAWCITMRAALPDIVEG